MQEATDILENHKAGYVNIIGEPNVGKSTLMNAMIGTDLSIITSKPQTTRHRILGIYNDPGHQVVFSDTPGLVFDPKYAMHESMNDFAYSSFEDADILVLVIDPFQSYTGEEDVVIKLQKSNVPKYLVINKKDLGKEDLIAQAKEQWKDWVAFDEVFEISALHKLGTDELWNKIKSDLPVSLPYYPKDEISNRNVRFFVSEIVREKILEQFKQEIPYSCEVIVDEYKDSEKGGKPFAHIYASIYVSRKSQKGILIGKGAAAIKQLGVEARKKIEEFVGHQVFLELKVKVKDNWRNDEKMLKHFGYK